MLIPCTKFSMLTGSGPPPMAPPTAAAGPPPMMPTFNPEAPSPSQAPPQSGDGPSPSVILLPPASTTDLPKYTAPIIVPTMSPTEKDYPGSPIATNPVTNMPVNLEGASDELNMPNFDNDQQLYHYVVARLQKTLHDCKPSLPVSIAVGPQNLATKIMPLKIMPQNLQSSSLD